MIIQLESPRFDNVDAAARELGHLADYWGETLGAAFPLGPIGTIRPMAVRQVLIPSAVLTVLDPADRVRKRRRAEELIETVQCLTVAAWLILPSRVVELRTLTPDQLLDLAGEDPAS